jgi:putative ABC transport system substrate-binding protein
VFDLKRREFITLLGGAAATWASPLSAQQRGKAKVGVLYPGIASALPARLAGLRAGLQASDYRDEIELIPRSADGDPSRLGPLAAELVERKAEIIVAISPAAVRAARSATATIPIIALDVESDPVGSGLVKSLSRPGGQVTGVFFDFPDFSNKWLELLKEAIPGLARVAVLWDPGTGTIQVKGTEGAAKALGVSLEILEVRGTANLDDAILAASRNGADAVVMLSSPVFGTNPQHIAELTLRLRLPAVTLFPDFARFGGLMAYGVNPVDIFRQGGTMVAKVLRGTKPAELPAELPTKFQMVVNLGTAKALGIEVPTSILLRADEVIE